MTIEELTALAALAHTQEGDVVPSACKPTGVQKLGVKSGVSRKDYPMKEVQDPALPDDRDGVAVLGPDCQVDAYYAECVEVTVDIDQDMRRAGADYAYWSERYWQSVEKHLTLKAEVERYEARSYIEERERLLDVDKPTEALIKACVAARPELHALRLRMIAAEAAKAKHKGRVDSVGRKIDMLQSLGAKIRKEMDADPVVRRAYAMQAQSRKDREDGEDL